MTIIPITVKGAKKLVAEWHRHLPDLQGALFAAALEHDGAVVGVACAGNPARVWQGTRRLVISRVAISPSLSPERRARELRVFAALRRSLSRREGAWLRRSMDVHAARRAGHVAAGGGIRVQRDERRRRA